MALRSQKKTARGTATAGMMALVLLMLAGCDNLSTTQKSTGVGALLGAGGGALVGSAVGHPVAGTLIGAGMGTAGGYVVGRGLQHNEDAQRQTQSQIDQQQGEIQQQRREIRQLQEQQNTE